MPLRLRGPALGTWNGNAGGAGAVVGNDVGTGGLVGAAELKTLFADSNVEVVPGCDDGAEASGATGAGVACTATLLAEGPCVTRLWNSCETCELC